MNTYRTTRMIGQAALVALLAAPVLGAQIGRRDDSDRNDHRGSDTYDRSTVYDRRNSERTLFTWRGNVDAGARIIVRGDRVQALDANSKGRGRARSLGKVDVQRSLPRRDGIVRVQVLEGRGRVDVVQQPTARNDYTAILQVRDWQGGKDQYRLVAYFQPSDGYGNSRDGRVWGSNGGDVSGTTALHWSGNVDGDLRISLWRGQLSYQTMSGGQPTNVRASVGNAGRSAGYLSVQQRMGRGNVQVLEQPSQYNNYTAVVRVLDPQGGYGYYDFDLIWQ